MVLNKKQALDLINASTGSYAEQAKMIAFWFHRDHVDKQGVPYFKHVHDVAERVAMYAYNESTPTLENWEEVTVAYLHDLLEDSVEFTIADLQNYFPWPEVVDAVLAITHHENDPYENYLEIVKANPIALKVKLADIASNLSRIDELDDETGLRLYKKYTKALRYLKGD